MALNDTYVAIGGELCSMFSYFSKYVVIDICHGCGCLSSYEQVFYIWGHSYVMTTSPPTVKPELRFQPPVQLGCMHMTDLSSTNQMYCVKNSFLKWVKCANNSCAKLSILLHGWWQGYWAFIRGWWGEEGFWRQQQQHLLHNPNSASVFLEIVSGSLAPSLVSSPPVLCAAQQFLNIISFPSESVNISYNTVLTLVLCYYYFSCFLQIFIEQKITYYLLCAEY